MVLTESDHVAVKHVGRIEYLLCDPDGNLVLAYRLPTTVETETQYDYLEVTTISKECVPMIYFERAEDVFMCRISLYNWSDTELVITERSG